MEIIIIVNLVVILICVLLIWYITTYNNYQSYIIRINEAEANIDSVLRKRYDLLVKSINIIKANTDQKKVLEELKAIKSKKISNFELDRKIYEAINEFNSYKEEFRDLKKCEGFMKIELGINETEAEIEALRKYYNDIISDYNKLIKSFPSNIVGLFSHFKSKSYFDGKNLQKEDNLKL